MRSDYIRLQPVGVSSACQTAALWTMGQRAEGLTLCTGRFTIHAEGSRIPSMYRYIGSLHIEGGGRDSFYVLEEHLGDSF